MSKRFYFAWAEPSETVFGPQHQREDEKIVGFAIEHAEGELPTLSIEIRNPRIGLLAPGRKVWAWLSWDNGSAVTPLFFGRLVGIPTDILAEACTLLFVAKPLDYFAQKVTVAETLKVRPNYDPVWIDAEARDDPDTVLEGYSALWHVDRTSHVVTVSDILVGEDGIEDFTQGEVPYDSVALALNQAPLTAIDVDATVAWKQVANGAIDLGQKVINSLSDSVLKGWPEAGASIGAGWSVESGYAIDVFGHASAQMYSGSVSYTNRERTHRTGDVMSHSNSYSYPLVSGFTPYSLLGTITGQFTPGNYGGILLWSRMQIGMLDPYADPPVNTPAEAEEAWSFAPVITVMAGLVVRYDAKRDRTERVRFTLTADLQDVVTLPRDEESPDRETITLTGAGDLPIGEASRRSYFPTDRGLWSLEHLIARARAHLVQRSRVVEVSFDCPFERAIGLSCRKNARLFDPRLPGGQALGKIIAYRIKGDGDAGRLIGNVIIGCAVGRGNAIAAVEGEPSYAEADYVEADYQFYSDAVVALPTGDIGYTPPIDEAGDDGLVFPLDYRQAVVRDQVIGSIEQQQVTFTTERETGHRTINYAESPVWYELELRPVTNGPFDVEYDIGVLPVTIPKMIDLEAAAA